MKKVAKAEMQEAVNIFFGEPDLPVTLKNVLADVINTGSARQWANAKLNLEILRASRAERAAQVKP